MTRSDLRDELRFNLKRNSSALPDSRLNTWLNWSLQYIADLHTYEEMRKTTTDTTPSDRTSNTMNFPTNMKDLYSITVQNGGQSTKLIYVYPRLFDKVIPRIEERGTDQPTHYVDYGTTYELYPIPDQAYTLRIRYSKYPAEMTDDTDTPELTRKDALIVAVATVFGFWSLREVEDAAYWGAQIVPTLYNASLSSDHSAEDWTPIARPYRVSGATLEGEWWKNPFTGRTLPY